MKKIVFLSPLFPSRSLGTSLCKLILLLVFIAASFQCAYAEDLPDTAWSRSFDPESVVDAKFSPDDSLIYVATSGGVYSVDTKTGDIIKKFYSIPDGVNNIFALTVSPDGKFIAVAYEGIVTIINTLTSDIYLEINTINS